MSNGLRPQSIHPITSDTDVNLDSINMIIYGFPGCGKTPFWGTGGPRVLIMDSDHGTTSAKVAGSKAHRINVIEYPALEDVFQFFKNGSGCKEYDWVIWDSVTLFQDRALIDEVLADAHAENPRQSADVASQREYLINMNRIMRYVRGFVDCPVNFGISAHVMLTEDAANDDATLWVPHIQGKGMWSKVSGYCNVIGYMTRQSTDREKKEGNAPFNRILFQQSGKYFARDRWGVLGKVMKEPTLPQIEAKIKARMQELKSPTRPIRRRVVK